MLWTNFRLENLCSSFVSMVIIFNKLLIVFKGVRKKIEHDYVYP
jgi:hypothetical protein